MSSKKVKYRPTIVKGSNESLYHNRLRFKSVDPKPIKSNSKPGGLTYLEMHNISLTSSSKILRSVNFVLPDWIQVLKNKGAGSISRFHILCFIGTAGLSFERTDLQDRKFIANCLQNYQPTLNSKLVSTPTPRNIFNTSTTIFPLLEEATKAYFNNINIFDPFFTQANFFSQPRSEFLKLCVWRVGLQFLPSSELLTELCHDITQEILIRLVPSKISFNLGTLQGLSIISIGIFDPTFNKYRVYFLSCASRIITSLGIPSISPRLLNQEQFLALFTLRHSNSLTLDATKMAWYDEFTEPPLKISTWPHKSYPNVGSLYIDHPNHIKSNFFCSEPNSAALDANITTLCICSYHFIRLKFHSKKMPGLKKKLYDVLAWGTRELEKSKAVQLPNREFISLASFSEFYSQNLSVNYSSSNSVLSILQLTLHSRFHHMMLSDSEPQHTFKLIDCLKLFSGPSLFSRLPMLLTATRYLLFLPWDSKIEQYLEIVRTCLKRMQTEPGGQYACRHLALFEALVVRAKNSQQKVLSRS